MPAKKQDPSAPPTAKKFSKGMAKLGTLLSKCVGTADKLAITPANKQSKLLKLRAKLDKQISAALIQQTVIGGIPAPKASE